MRRFIIGAVVIFVAAIIVLNFVIGLPGIATPLHGQLKPTQTKAIELLVESNKLLISFSLALVGGLAFFIRETYKNKEPLRKLEVILMLICGASSMFSIFFGQLALSLIVEMLVNDILDLFATSIVLAVRAQYAFVLIGIASLLLFVFEISRGRST